MRAWDYQVKGFLWKVVLKTAIFWLAKQISSIITEGEEA
jgi:hypothetical protein